MRRTPEGGPVVPLLELLHELEVAGATIDEGALAREPVEAWMRLPVERRQALAGAAGALDAPEARLLVRRGQPSVLDHLVLHVRDPRKRLRNRLEDALLRVRYAPTAGVSDAAAVFKPGNAVRRSTVEILDAGWGSGESGVVLPYVQDEASGLTTVTEAYWVDAPFARVVIGRYTAGEPTYVVVEPPLTQLEARLLVALNERLRDSLVYRTEAGTDRAIRVARQLFQLLRLYRVPVDRRSAYKLGYYLLRNYVGLGRLEPLLRDMHLEDVSCNGPRLPLYVVHGRHGSIRTSVTFEEIELISFTIKLAQRGGKLLSVAHPLVDATLPDGSRVQASLGREVTARGSTFTIRRFREDPLTAVDLVRSGSYTPEIMAHLWLAVEARRNLIVMGATASGKTTTLNSLGQFVPPADKIVTIEDTREITLQHENWLAAVTRETFTGREEGRIGMFDLLRAALRQRPDYLVVGEIRGIEGLTLFQAMSTGHTCFSTMHAGSVENAVYRLENAPIGVPRVMLTALDFFILQGQVEIGGRSVRRMLSLTEIDGVDAASRNLRTNELFRWDAESDRHEVVNASGVLARVRERRGWSRARLDEELDARRRVLDALVARGTRHYREVASTIRAFYAGRVSEEPPPVRVPVRERESSREAR